MSGKTIGAARFKAECLKLIDQITEDHEPVTITKRGKPVAVLNPIASKEPVSILGALQGTVLRYDDPFASAADPADWNAGP
jgi:prevent-host-death family protein